MSKTFQEFGSTRLIDDGDVVYDEDVVESGVWVEGVSVWCNDEFGGGAEGGERDEMACQLRALGSVGSGRLSGHRRSSKRAQKKPFHIDHQLKVRNPHSLLFDFAIVNTQILFLLLMIACSTHDDPCLFDEVEMYLAMRVFEISLS